MSYELILGDCLEIMPTLPDKSVDLILTDPPYPGLKGGLKHSVGGVSHRVQPTITVGTPWGDELEALRDFQRVARYGAIVFCSWHSIGEVRSLLGGEAVGLVTWYKRNSQTSFRNRPHYMCEYAWLVEYKPGLRWNVIKTHYDIPGLAAGCMATERLLESDTSKALHPTQKPLELISQLVLAAPKNSIVLDPYMGTGTTGVSCKLNHQQFIGIELESKYFNVAKKRIAETQPPAITDEGVFYQPEQAPLFEVTA